MISYYYSNSQVRDIKKAKKLSNGERSSYFGMLSGKWGRTPNAIYSKYISIVNQKKTKKRKKFLPVTHVKPPLVDLKSTISIPFIGINIDMENRRVLLTLM